MLSIDMSEEVLLDICKKANLLSQVEIIVLVLWLCAFFVRRGSEWMIERLFFPLATSERGQQVPAADIAVEVIEKAAGFKNMVSKREVEDEESWGEYFEDPLAWWDNRGNKLTNKSPDFINKLTKKALWIVGGLSCYARRTGHSQYCLKGIARRVWLLVGGSIAVYPCSG